MMPPDLPSSLRARILESAQREPVSTSGAHAGKVAALCLFAIVWLVAPLLLLGVRPDFHELPAHYSLGTLVFLGLSGTALSALAVSRGPRMLGLRAEWLLSAIVVLPIAMCAWSSFVVGQGPSSYPCASAMAALQLSPACILVSIVIGTPLAGALLWFRRGVLGGSPALTGAVMGAAAASWAQIIMHTHCPIAHPLHALVGHVLPMLPVAALSALLATKLR